MSKETIMKCGLCGAICDERKHLNRFLARHPKVCGERKGFTSQLAAGTRSVDADDEIAARRKKRWDAIEWALGGTPQ